jgi:hypothetical protein
VRRRRGPGCSGPISAARGTHPPRVRRCRAWRASGSTSATAMNDRSPAPAVAATAAPAARHLPTRPRSPGPAMHRIAVVGGGQARSGHRPTGSAASTRGSSRSVDADQRRYVGPGRASGIGLAAHHASRACPPKGVDDHGAKQVGRSARAGALRGARLGLRSRRRSAAARGRRRHAATADGALARLALQSIDGAPVGYRRCWQVRVGSIDRQPCSVHDVPGSVASMVDSDGGRVTVFR